MNKPDLITSLQNKALLRQLKRTLGIREPDQLTAALAELEQNTQSCSASTQALISGLGQFFAQVGGAYDQYERDLALKTRSLELSSEELSTANDRLRTELHGRESVLTNLRSALQGLMPTKGELSRENMESDIAWLSIRLAALVTETESSRRALANQKFALDQHAIVSVTNTEGLIVYANDRFCAISGYPREELIGQSQRLVNSGVHPKAFFTAMWETITKGGVWHGEVCNKTRTGERYWVSATVLPLAGPDGHPEQFISIQTDITDRKQIERALSEQLVFVETLLEAVPLPVYMKDQAGRYQRLNQACEKLFGVKREEWLGKTLTSVLQPEDVAFHQARDEELFAKGGFQTFETAVTTRDGRRRDTIYRKAILTDQEGRRLGLLGVVIDISELKETQRALLQAKEAAEAASRAKSDFLANMSHEIRTPMNGIIGMTSLALYTDLTPDQREYIEVAKSSAEALLTIINDILDFSKIEAGRLDIEALPFELSSLVQEVFRTLTLPAQQKGLRFSYEIAPDLPPAFLGDAGRIRQILINLLGNAIKFTEVGEVSLHVRLAAEPQDEVVLLQFSVRDTGIGISPEKQQMIFEAFTQEDTSITRRFGGTGLGLSISRRLTELMQGRLWMESQLCVGSTFHVQLPLLPVVTSPAVSVSEDQPGQPVVIARSLNVLLVEDNPINQRVANQFLRRWGHHVVTADDGEQGVASFALQAFDLILMDMHMPVLGGLEATAEIRREEARRGLPRTPIIAMTAAAMESDREACLAAGMDAYLAKPIDFPALENLLARL